MKYSKLIGSLILLGIAVSGLAFSSGVVCAGLAWLFRAGWRLVDGGAL